MKSALKTSKSRSSNTTVEERVPCIYNTINKEMADTRRYDS